MSPSWSTVCEIAPATASAMATFGLLSSRPAMCRLVKLGVHAGIHPFGLKCVAPSENDEQIPYPRP